MVKKLRNPFKNPIFMFEQIWRRHKIAKSDPSYSIGISSYLHPSLDTSAKSLEYCVHRLSYATEVLLQRHGADVINPKLQLELKRVADNMIDIYAMTAVLARASRSYCIGLKDAQTEVTLRLIYLQNNFTNSSQNENNPDLMIYRFR